jgi:hypothetical protein
VNHLEPFLFVGWRSLKVHICSKQTPIFRDSRKIISKQPHEEPLLYPLKRPQRYSPYL